MAVSTRRRARSRSNAEEEDATSPPTISQEDPKNKKRSPGRKRAQQKKASQALKAKNTGTGLKIPTDDSSTTRNEKSNKTVFHSDDEGDESKAGDDDERKTDNGKGPQATSAAMKKNDDDGDDVDDDDAVEEVKGTKAREEMLEKLDEEEKTALRPKKRKKRKDRIAALLPETELDDDFFAQLESVRAHEKEQQTKREQQKGKHTTFVIRDEGNTSTHAGSNSAPVAIDDTIQVVVTAPHRTAHTNSMEAFEASVPSESMSKDSMIYSRGLLLDGKDSPAPASHQKRKREQDPTWKRSKKMTALALGRSGLNRMGGRAVAALASARKVR